MITRPEDLTESLLAIRSIGKERKGVSTGWGSIDEFMLMNKKYLFLITGYPSYGKSTFVDALAMNMASQHGWRWLFFSTETDDYTTHLRKLVCIYSGKSLISMSVSEITSAVNWVNNYFSWINPPKDSFLTLDDVLRITKTHILNGKTVDALVIDPWNELNHGAMTQREDQYVQNSLMRVKAFSKLYDIMPLIVIHPTKQEKNNDGSFPIPHLRNCAGGAMWWNKADYGLCVHRTNFAINGVHVYVQKVKDSSIGRQGATFLDCDPSTLRLKDTFSNDFYLPMNDEDFPPDD